MSNHSASQKQAALYSSTHELVKEIIEASATDVRKPTIADIVHAAVTVLHDRVMWEKKNANTKKDSESGCTGAKLEPCIDNRG